MARNMVQFQKGLSEVAFQGQYGTEEQCQALVIAWRWPDGFVCPRCGERPHCLIKPSRAHPRGLYQCNDCRAQTSPIAGTIFASSKLALTVWFRAIYQMTQTKQGISSIELGRRLGIGQKAAWTMKSKLAEVMKAREAEKPLDGRVEMDDVYLGGERHDGKRGRGAPGKKPFIAAVQTTDDGRPLRVKLRRVKRFSKVAVRALAEKHLKKTARVVTDGLGCFHGIAAAGMTHERLIAAKLGHSEKLPQFKWVNTILGNIKGSITGTYRGARKHAGRTLAEFEYRFNRRFDLAAMIPRLGYVATRTPPMPYRLLKLAEDET